MPRKYEGYANRDGVAFISPRFVMRTDDEPVTAYDARDVEPLVEALQHAQEVLGAESVSAEEEVQALMHVGEVLEAFEEDS